ncbi:copper resistance CopC family protein [Clavibacter michiganensis]|uniref:copper resistance CopC family protein n=1 Tax=Clavibacter michiganensis TaxID=28447 RepID=UPI000A3AB538|nr:copper resistance CopC family protein [Clavibacter michiganensis]MDO4098814.1 copper resistance protein CopC [Clavibacter michiganensis]MDO4127880.1 copper resistance protein CopC [Clavibacter michiganensis]MWJ15261.1 copper resistance protein CopC [Clavibacter michiganensis subsp. michiganensis]NIY59502.1 copper resistance protein CopC [Clavibacter michiganensis subsp. michiganensis]OUE22067.1 Copper transport protein YcnJ precursor [Clavibacter michiganensis subsp. michiganensis]
MTPGDRIPARTGRRPLWRLAAAVAGAALATGALALVGLAQGSGPDGALSASAHNYLVSSSPAAGSTIDAPPSEVTLTFNDVILDLAAAGGGGGDASTGSAPASGGSSVVQVTGPDGQGTHFETGCATDSGRTVSVPVALGGSGQYTVTWRVVSADGHPVSDSIAFTYQAPAGATASAGTPDGPGCAAAQEGATGSGATSSGGAGSSAADPGTAAGQEQGVAPYLGVIVGVGIGIVVLAAAAVVLIVVTGRRKPAAAAATGDAGGDAPRDGGPPVA